MGLQEGSRQKTRAMCSGGHIFCVVPAHEHGVPETSALLGTAMVCSSHLTAFGLLDDHVFS